MARPYDGGPEREGRSERRAVGEESGGGGGGRRVEQRRHCRASEEGCWSE